MENPRQQRRAKRSNRIVLLFVLCAVSLASVATSPAHASVASTEIIVMASDAAPGDLYGWSVDTDGTTAIALAIDGQAGVAYLIDQATGNELHKLVASDGLSGLQFEASAAVDGNYAIVGSGEQDKAWVFDVNTGDELYSLTESGLPHNSYYGRSVDISGNRAIVGGYSGEVYVYDVATGDEIIQLMRPPDAVPFFGVSVAIDGDLAIVGADNDFNGQGEAYVFDVTTGELLQTLAVSDGVVFDSFGTSVAIDGTMALVGASGIQPNSAAYIFNAITGEEIWKLEGDDAAQSAFGNEVALSGNYAAVGAWRHTHERGGPKGAGSTYLFNVTTGDQILELLASDAFGGDAFGLSIGLAGNQLISASTFHDGGRGQAYLYTIPEPGAFVLFLVGLVVWVCVRRSRRYAIV